MTRVEPITAGAQKRSAQRPHLGVAYVSTYVPRRCGIATFTEDLRLAVSPTTGPTSQHLIVAIDGPGAEVFEYPDEVAFQMHRDRPDDYQRAAEFINFSDVDVVCVQHEFGIYGGEGGMHLLRMLRSLRKPVVTTLHTVLAEPAPQYRRGLMAVANWSSMLVVMTQHCRQVLIEQYGLDPTRIEIIPHGAPSRPDKRPRDLKARFDLRGRKVLLTFGLLSPGKGIETALKAVAQAAGKHANMTYMVVGATHPEVKRLYGEDYRVKLERMVHDLGIRGNVLFYNQYLTKEELIDLLQMCDIYLAPYPNLAQAVSGTLSYAMSLGNAVVATPFQHAKEVLAEDRGILFPPNDAKALGDILTNLLDNPDLIGQYKHRALEYGRQIAWPRIGQQYLDLFQRVQNVYGLTVRVEKAAQPPAAVPTVVEPRFEHMVRLTDGTGILQHAVFRTPDRFHGYCTDDNARALQVALMNQDALDRMNLGHLTSQYLSFLHYAQREDGRFHNFMSYHRQWVDDVGSQDCQGRAVWSLGLAVSGMRDSMDRLLAKQLFDRGVPAVRTLTSPRARAYAMLGLGSYIQRYPESADIRRLLADHASALLAEYNHTRRPGWLWYEDVMTYANGKLPQAMLLAGDMLQNAEYRTVGGDSLKFLTDQILRGDHFSLIGTNGWLEPGRPKADFAQQPIDASALVSAYRTAAWVLQDEQYLTLAGLALDWFLGANDLQVTLYDFGTGACCDGLEGAGVNINQGAESTLCCLKAFGLMADPNNPRLV